MGFSRFQLQSPFIALGNVMSEIGPVLHDPATMDWDAISYHGSYHIFQDVAEEGAYLLRCVVWRDTASGAIVGHNFDYTRASSRAWWTASEAGSPEACLGSVNPRSRDDAICAVRKFRATKYPALIAGSLRLHEIAARGRALPGSITAPPELDRAHGLI